MNTPVPPELVHDFKSVLGLELEIDRRAFYALIVENDGGIRDRIRSVRDRAVSAGHPPVQRPLFSHDSNRFDDRRWPWG